ncbi:MAG: hypothetical protein RR928_16205 [Comamonas sp.]
MDGQIARVDHVKELSLRTSLQGREGTLGVAATMGEKIGVSLCHGVGPAGRRATGSRMGWRSFETLHRGCRIDNAAAALPAILGAH